MSDVNDLGKGGVSTTDAGKAALAQSLFVITSTAHARRQGEEGLRRLRELTQEVLATQSKRDAGTLWRDFCGESDTNALLAAGCAAGMESVISAQTALLRERLSGGVLNEWMRVTRKRGRSIQKDLEEREVVRSNDASADNAKKLLRHMGATDLLVVPPGYVLTDDGVHHAGDEIMTEPLIVSNRYQDPDTGQLSIELTWLNNKEKYSTMVRASSAMSARELVGLSNWGLMVSSDNAGQVARYIRKFIAANVRHLVPKPMGMRTGWLQVGGEMRFLLPGLLIGPDGPAAVVTSHESAMPPMEQSGSWPAWSDMMDRFVADYPLAYTALYASLAPPLLHILKQDGLVFEYYGLSSTGKTTALKVAASVWGKPAIGGQGFIKPWNSTYVGIVSSMAGGLDLPALFDDYESMSAQEKEVTLEKTIYAVTQSERVRGTRDGGIIKPRAIRTVLITGGESSIVSYGNKKAGAEARTVSIGEAPFGGETDKTRRMVPELLDSLGENYGHLGPKYLERLVAMQNDWGQLRDRYRSLCSLIEERASADGADARLIRKFKSLAMLQLASDLLHDDFRLLRRPERAVFSLIIDQTVMLSRDRDPAKGALKDVYNWAVSRKGQFADTPLPNKKDEPHGGGLGLWDSDCIFVFPAALRRCLKSFNHDPSVVINAWSHKGYLMAPAGQTKIRRHFLSRSAEFYGVDLRAVTAVMDGGDYEPREMYEATDSGSSSDQPY